MASCMLWQISRKHNEYIQQPSLCPDSNMENQPYPNRKNELQAMEEEALDGETMDNETLHIQSRQTRL